MNKILINQKKKNIFFLIDQGFLSFSNFLIGILIYRFLGLNDFAIFSLIWFLSHLINSLQVAGLINILNSSFKINNKSFFYTTLFYCELFFSLILIIILSFLIDYLFKYLEIKNLNKLSIIFFYIIFQYNNFIKRIFYYEGLLKISLINNLFIYLGSILLIVYNYYYTSLNLQTFFNFFSIIVLFSTLLFSKNFFCLLKFTKRKLIHFKYVWNYSKWLVLSNISEFFCLNLWQINLAAIINPAILGIFRACYNLASFLNIFYLAFENIFPKIFSKIVHVSKNNKSIILKNILNFNFNLLKFSLPLSLIIFIYAEEIFNLVYPEINILNYNHILILSFVATIISGFKYPIYFTIRSIGNTKIIFIGTFISAVLTLVFSNIIISANGILGFLYGIIIIQINFSVITMLILYKNI